MFPAMWRGSTAYWREALGEYPQAILSAEGARNAQFNTMPRPMRCRKSRLAKYKAVYEAANYCYPR